MENSFILSQKTIPDLRKFHNLIAESVPEFVGLVRQDTTVHVILNVPPTTELISQIEAIIPPPSMTQLEQVKMVIANSIAFGNDLISQFAAENVIMGITQANKTKAVADYLSDVTRYLSTGSLYEVINEINRLQQNEIPQDLTPFVTNERMNEFKNKIEDYLS